MKRFTRLFTELDETNRTSEKLAALEAYFREAPPEDAVWGLAFLCGRRPPRAVTATALRDWAAEEAGLPVWLVEECYESVGDLGEVISLILPDSASQLSLPLHRLVQERLLPLNSASAATRREVLLTTWRELDTREKLVWNKLITGGFRIGVAQTLVVRALAAVAGIPAAVMAHRLLGAWQPVREDFLRLLDQTPETTHETARPYPFYLASQLEAEPASLGDVTEWQVEWKWDGIRAQFIRRSGEMLLWSRGDEMVTATFPEIAAAGHALPDGTVLDGEILAWVDGRPQPFGQLQRRLGRKAVSRKMREQVPVVFLAYDLLESDGLDWRPRPLTERRRRLEAIMEEAAARGTTVSGPMPGAVDETPDLFALYAPEPAPELPLRLSPLLHPAAWAELYALQGQSRERQVEGLMLKRASSPYGSGRQRGDWWKWKVDPLVIDAVLVSAQPGHGKRAGMFTDYTFAVRQDDRLVPVAKAYSGLTDEEITKVDAFVRANTTGRFGPLRSVKPVLVFELAFDSVQESDRHKSGVAVRFPRINRWRHDKKPPDANTLDDLRQLMNATPAGHA